MGTNPPLLDQTGLAKSAVHWRVAVLSHQGWWSDSRLPSKEWALHRGLYSGAGSIWRWRVRHGLGECVTASSDWACCHCRQSEMFRNLQVPWWKSGVTSHSKNGQIWCSPWGGDALQYSRYFWFWPPPFVQGHTIQLLLVTCLWNLFSLCLSCWIMLCSYKYLHMLIVLKFKRSWQWENVYFVAEFIFAISETHWDPLFDDTAVAIQGYNIFEETNAYGSAVYIQSHIPVMLREDLMSSIIEVLWLQVHLAHLKPFLLGCCYRPPSANCPYLNNKLSKKRNVLSLSITFMFSKLNMRKYLYEHSKIQQLRHKLNKFHRHVTNRNVIVSVELVQFVSVVESCYVHTNIYAC